MVRHKYLKLKDYKKILARLFKQPRLYVGYECGSHQQPRSYPLFLGLFPCFISRFCLSLFLSSSVILPLSVSPFHSSSSSCLGHFPISRGLAISTTTTTTKKVCFCTRHHHHHSGLSYFLRHSSTPNFLLLVLSIVLHKLIVNIAKHERIL